MPTMDDENESGIFRGDTLEEKLYNQMRISFLATVEGQDLHPVVERSIVQLYLGEIHQNNVAEAFRQYMSKSDGRSIVKVAMNDWKRACDKELKQFVKSNKAHKREGNKYRDSWN